VKQNYFEPAQLAIFSDYTQREALGHFIVEQSNVAYLEHCRIKRGVISCVEFIQNHFNQASNHSLSQSASPTDRQKVSQSGFQSGSQSVWQLVGQTGR